MIKIFRALIWVYLTGYTLSLLAMLGLNISADRFDLPMLVWWAPLLVPSIVLFRAMRGQRTHWLFHALGIYALIDPILGAHKFLSLEGVTLGMYIWFVPMALAMFYLVFQRVKIET